MTPFAKALFDYGTAMSAEERAYAIGSPEAIADCQRRVLAAQLAARAAIDSNQDVADRLVNGAASDGWDCLIPEYETDHEADEIEGGAV